MKITPISQQQVVNRQASQVHQLISASTNQIAKQDSVSFGTSAPKGMLYTNNLRGRALEYARFLLGKLKPSEFAMQNFPSGVTSHDGFVAIAEKVAHNHELTSDQALTFLHSNNPKGKLNAIISHIEAEMA